MALLLSYFEIWPERVLGLVFGDPADCTSTTPDPGLPARGKRKAPPLLMAAG